MRASEPLALSDRQDPREVLNQTAPLPALIAKWRDFSARSLANAENEKIQPLDRRQCFGVSQAFNQCADELSALLMVLERQEEHDEKDSATRIGQLAVRPAPQHASTDVKG
jgi:hypothetical protein